MDALLVLLNAATCGALSLVLVFAILSPRVRDGVVIKAGLILMALGFGSIALLMFDGLAPHEVESLERALLMINAGITVVIVGYLLRKAKVRHPVRRSTDWAELESRP